MEPLKFKSEILHYPDDLKWYFAAIPQEIEDQLKQVISDYASQAKSFVVKARLRDWVWNTSFSNPDVRRYTSLSMKRENLVTIGIDPDNVHDKHEFTIEVILN